MILIPLMLLFTATPSPRDRGDLAIQAHHTLIRYCGECHGGAADQGDLNVRDFNGIVRAGRPVPFIATGGAGPSLLMQFLEDGSMPPAGVPRVPPEELETLKRWVTAGAPGYPAKFGPESAANAVAVDLAARPGDPPGRFRYISFAHLIVDGQVPDLRAAEASLRQALAVAGGKDITATAVDDAATVYRLDVAKAGWNAPGLFTKITERMPAGVADFTPFDLILLEYPYEAKADRDALRGDWLSGVLYGTPLAADLKSLPPLAQALADDQRGKLPAGPTPLAAGTLTARPELLPPPDAWYAGNRNPAPELTLLNLGPNTPGRVTTGEPFRLQVRSPTPAWFHLILVQADGVARLQPVAGDNKLAPGELRRLKPPTAGAFVVGSVLTGKPTAREFYVLLASDVEFPAPEIITSRHGDNKITRFRVPNPAGRVGRRILPYTITIPRPGE